jgi:hypothetical protein
VGKNLPKNVKIMKSSTKRLKFHINWKTSMTEILKKSGKPLAPVL